MGTTTEKQAELLAAATRGGDGFAVNPFDHCANDETRVSIESMLARMNADLAEAAGTHFDAPTLSDVIDTTLAALASAGSLSGPGEAHGVTPPVPVQEAPRVPDLPEQACPGGYSVVYSTVVGDIKTEYTSVERQGQFLVLAGRGRGDQFIPRAGAGEPGTELRLRVSGPGWTDVSVVAYHLGIVFSLHGETVLVLVVEEGAVEKRGVIAEGYSPASALRPLGYGVPTPADIAPAKQVEPAAAAQDKETA